VALDITFTAEAGAAEEQEMRLTPYQLKVVAVS